MASSSYEWRIDKLVPSSKLVGTDNKCWQSSRNRVLDKDIGVPKTCIFVSKSCSRFERGVADTVNVSLFIHVQAAVGEWYVYGSALYPSGTHNSSSWSSKSLNLSNELRQGSHQRRQYVCTSTTIHTNIIDCQCWWNIRKILIENIS